MTRITPAVKIDFAGSVAILTIDNPPVNAGSIEVRRELYEAVMRISAEDNCTAAVVIGAGSTFMAGSDIREFGKPIEEPQLPAVIRAIQDCPKPIIAAIHGAALGGGLELALGCDARVALAGSKVGLPEVTLGMIPGAGGTQHVPRLTGISTAIELVCSGRRVEAIEAKELGLVDQVVADNLLQHAIAMATQWGAEQRKRRLSEEKVPSGRAESIATAESLAMRAGRGRPQVRAAIEAIKSSAELPYAEALARERSVFQALRMSPEAAALRHLFFAEREARKIGSVQGISPQPVRHVGVIGAGLMGVGIAVCFADAGCDVILIDRSDEAIARGRRQIESIYSKNVASRKLDASTAAAVQARIRTSTDFAEVAFADLCIEAVFESMDVKINVFRQLDALMRPDAILASNTSYLNLDELAVTTGRPEQVIGLHFFSPANVMRLLEVVRGAQTNAQTLVTAMALAERLRKIPVISRVGEGFIGNRIYAAYRRQCEFMLEEGAYPEEIDSALEAFGFPMGPFAVGDMSGLDIAWRMRQRLNATRDPRTRYVEIPDRLCERGRFGQKSGAGWYRYESGSRKPLVDQEVHHLIDSASAVKGYKRRRFTAEDIQRRALFAMVNEAALIVHEKIAERASDVDVVMVNGYGFPKHEGGPLFWASRQPKKDLLSGIDELEKVSGYGFRKGDVLSCVA